MHVGYAPIFQNLGNAKPDHEVFANELHLTDLAEPLGFDSIWQPEHHFTDYEMTPDVLQFLSYMAGRTKRVRLGSMVVVLPWHDPLRVAEQILLLDQLSNGRAILGIGRGLGAVEFDAFRVDMNESRVRFLESAEAIIQGLGRGYMEYQGSIIKQPRIGLRPGPLKSYVGRTFAATLSPDTMPLLAKLGVAVMVIPLKAWEDVKESLSRYRQTWGEVWGERPSPKPMLVSFLVTDKDPGRAKDAAYKYVGRYYQSVLDHYQMKGDHFASKKGYEFYANLKLDDEAEKFINLMPWGTPDQVLEKLSVIRSYIDMNAVVGHFAFGGMPYEFAESSLRLFAKEVMPELRKWKTEPFAEVEPNGLGSIAESA